MVSRIDPKGHIVTVSIDSRKQQIKEIVCDILELEPEEVTETSLFKEDHGADSLRAIEILANLERAFGVLIDQAELARMVNLEGVYTVVGESAAK
jgi:acyl carrier protein